MIHNQAFPRALRKSIVSLRNKSSDELHEYLDIKLSQSTYFYKSKTPNVLSCTLNVVHKNFFSEVSQQCYVVSNTMQIISNSTYFHKHSKKKMTGLSL